jgi:hypothetical protein
MNYRVELNDDNDVVRYNDLISNLQNYMLNKENISQFNILKYQNCKKAENVNNVKNINNINNIFFNPNLKDTLFWCLFFIKNSMVPDNINLVVEKKYKIEYIEKIRKNKQLLKSLKLSSLSAIENKLVNENIINIETFLLLCALENINILYVSNKTYYESILNDADDDIHIIIRNKTKYSYNGCLKDDIVNFRKTLYKIENIKKPLLSVSSYKSSELIDICNKLNINTLNNETNKVKTKQLLYETISQYLLSN